MKVQKLLSVFLALLIVLSAFSVTAGASKADDVMQEIAATYSAIRSSRGKTYKGWCGQFVIDQLNYMNIGLVKSGGLNGNQWYYNLVTDAVTTHGYKQVKYGGNNCLNNIVSAKGSEVYNVVVSFKHQYGYTDSNPGAGHVVLLHAILDGYVYFCECYTNSKANEGQPQKRTISAFMSAYNGSYGAAIGAIHFEKQGSPDPDPDPTPINPDDYPVPTRNIGYYNNVPTTGEDVKWVQAVLSRLGYSITIDGSFGPASKSTLMQFQADHGLTADGSCGPVTREKLIELWNAEKNGPVYFFYYDANGGTLEDPDACTFSVSYSQDFSVYNDNCTRSGYDFTGWNVKRSNDNTWYVAGRGWCSESTISNEGYSKKLYSNGQNLTLDDSWTNGISGDGSYTFYAVWTRTQSEPVNTYKTPVVYSQLGDKTAFNYPGGSGSTYSSSGCGIYSIVNAVQYLNDVKIDPHELGSYAISCGGRVNGGVTWDFAEKAAKSSQFGGRYGFEMTERYSFGSSSNKVSYKKSDGSYQTNSGYPSASQWSTLHNKLVSHLSKGEVAIVLVLGHFMAIVNYNPSTGKFLMLDSAAVKSKRLSANNGTWQWVSADELNWNTNKGYPYIQLRSSITFYRSTIDVSYDIHDPDNYPFPTRDLYYNGSAMTGSDVGWVQAVLWQLGYSIDVDQSFGPGTKKVVVQFQADHGLDQDGSVGPATRAKLKQCWEQIKGGDTQVIFSTGGIALNLTNNTSASLTATINGPYAHWLCEWDGNIIGVEKSQTGNQLNITVSARAEGSSVLRVIAQDNEYHELASAQITVTVGQPKTLDQTMYLNGHTYQFYSGKLTWTAAKEYAESLGGYLMTVTSASEQSLIAQYYADHPSSALWLGATNDNPEETWQWVTGETFDYDKWADEEPNNYNDVEHYVCTTTGAEWNDLANGSSVPTGFIVELEPVEQNRVVADGHSYVLYAINTSWHSAKDFAEAQGGYLVTVNSETENELLTEFVSDISGSIWIGATDETTGQWRWVTEEPFSYDGWNTGEPNNTNNNEDYAEFGTNGKWNDVPNVHSNVYGFVVETEIPCYSGETVHHAWNEVWDEYSENSVIEYVCTVCGVHTSGYVVSYDAQGGSCAPDRQIKMDDVSLTLSPVEPVKAGYTFICWTTDENAAGTDYLPGDVYSQNEPVTLYAFYRPETETAFWGDVNNDGTVNQRDASLISKFANGSSTPTAEQTFLADVDLSGSITDDDAQMVLSYFVANTYVFPAEKLAQFSFTAPVKTAYETGDEIDPAGMYITAVNKNDNTVSYSFSENVVLSGYDMSVPGQQTVTATWRSKTFSFPITVQQKQVQGPVILTQPVNAEVPEGERAYFHVVASGEGLTYRWQFSTNNGRSWYNSSGQGAATADLNVAGSVANTKYLYRCVITNPAGSVTTESVRVILTAAAPVAPVIDTQPVNAEVTEGARAYFHVVASGTGLTYQWQYSTDKGKTWKNSTGSGAATADLNVAGSANNAKLLYRCVITNAAGSVTTDFVRVVLSAAAPVAPVIDTQPVNAQVAAGARAYFHVVASGTGLTYQWQYSTDKGKTWKNSTGSGAATADLNVAGSAANAKLLYRCVITNAAGSVTTDIVRVVLTAVPPTIVTEPTDAVVTEGTRAYFHVVASGEGLTYQWQYSTDNGKTWVDSAEASAATADLDVLASASNAALFYRCVITNAAGSVTTDTVWIILTLAPVIVTEPTDAVVTEGERAYFHVAATGGNLSYQWQYSTDNGKTWKKSTASTATTADLNVAGSANNAKLLYRCVITNAYGTATTKTVKVTLA